SLDRPLRRAVAGEPLSRSPHPSDLALSLRARGARPSVVSFEGPAKVPPTLRDRGLPLRFRGVLPADTVRSATGSEGQLGAVSREFLEAIIQGVLTVTSHRVGMPTVGRKKANYVARPEPALLALR